MNANTVIEIPAARGENGRPVYPYAVVGGKIWKYYNTIKLQDGRYQEMWFQPVLHSEQEKRIIEKLQSYQQERGME